MSYLRRRRLTRIAEELSIQERRVIDLALEYQFASEPSLIRSFRESFGVTPGNFKRNTHPLWITPRLNLPGVGSRKAMMLFQPSQKLYGSGTYISLDEQEKESKACRVKAAYLKSTYPRLKLASEGPLLYSICRFSKEDSRGLNFFLGFTREELKSSPMELEEVEIPAHYQYISPDRVPKSIDKLRKKDLEGNYHEIYQHTLPQSAYQDRKEFTYTSLVVNQGLRRHIDYALHIPVMEKA